MGSDSNNICLWLASLRRRFHNESLWQKTVWFVKIHSCKAVGQASNSKYDITLSHFIRRTANVNLELGDNPELIEAVDGLVFDCDGTLADTMPLHFIAWRETLNNHGVEFSEDRFYAMAGQPTVEITKILLQEQGVAGDPHAISSEKETSFLNVLHQVEPIQPIVNIAKHYRATKRMGVGSGSNHAVVLQVLEHIGLTDFFDGVVGAEGTEKHKPEPDVFLEVARQIGVEPAKCRVYEDADLGIEAAKRAGMSCFDIREIFTPRRITNSA